MDEAAIIRYITNTFDGVNLDTADGDSFFSCDPERKFPFATLVTKDNAYDSVSNLDRPAVFRLNIGLTKATYHRLFGAQPARAAEDTRDTGYDFTALDQLLPHPVYGRMYWACVLNPSAATFQAVQPLLAEAHELVVSRHAKHATG
ncbi:MAG: DUF6194 family protein [Roseiflexaceae bacterium]